MCSKPSSKTERKAFRLRPLLTSLRRYIALAAVLVLLPVTAACGGGSASGGDLGQGPGGSRTNDEGRVTVKVTWDGRLEPLAFDVVLDTHSVDLDGYDLAELAILRIGQGRELRPTAWDAPKGGHHREGRLDFGALLDARPSSIELLIRGIDGRDRVFRWDLAGGAESR
jgi:hypothetical protein